MARINAVSFHEDPSIESICRKVRGAGFDSLELSRPPFYDKLVTRGLRQRFAAWVAELGLSLYGFDCWVEVDPYTARRETLDGFRAAAQFAADLELGMVITHDPWAKVNGDRSPRVCLVECVEFFRQVADIVAEKNLTLTFEPHPDTLSMDSAWAVDFIDALAEGHPAGSIGILYDSCHYGVGQSDRYVGAIATLGHRIRHVHFSDGDKQTYALHLPLGDGDLDLSAVVAALRSIGFAGTLTNDLYNYPLLENGAARNAPLIRQVEDRLGISSASIV